MKPTIVFLEQQSWLGGAQRVLESTLESVAETCDCIVAFPDEGPFRSALDQRNVETMDLPIGAYSSGSKSVLEMIAFAWRSLFCGLRLAGVIRRRRIALVYINGPRLLPAGVLAAWLTGRPAIFHLHLVLQRRLDQMLVTYLARRVSRILACSQAAAASLVGRDRELSAKTEVLYNPIRRSVEGRDASERNVHAQSNPDYFTVGMVGRITERKGQHLLLQAVGKLNPGLREKVRILIVGSEAPGCKSDFRYGEMLRAEAASHRLNGQIVWAGHQSDPGVYYVSMDVMVHTAHLHTEAMSLVILEALGQGIPVIAFRSGGTPEVVQDGYNGLLVSLEDTDGVTRSLELFLTSREVRERLQSGAACGLDPRFSMETFSSTIRNVIGQLCFPVRSRGASAPAAGSEGL
jgi:glycosyltransferase involved in cell wall biosynthesis